VQKKRFDSHTTILFLWIFLLAGSSSAPRAHAAAPAPAPPAPADAAAADAAKPAENHFDVHEYRVLGNTVLTNRQIETVLYPLLGDQKTLKDVEAARAALEKTYHDHGYATVFVDIPEQDVSDKVVRLKVTEGRLHEVRISGARYYSERQILAAVPEARPGNVPNVPLLQQQLSAVNVQSADRAIVPVLKAGPDPGTVDLSLKVDDHLPVHGSVQIDNQYTPDTETLRLTGTLSYNNLFQDLDSLSGQYQVSPQNASQVEVAAVNYAWGASPFGFHPSLYFIYSDSNVPTVGTLGVLGKGQVVGSHFAYFLNASPAAPQSLTLGIDYKHFLQTVSLASTPGLSTPITYTNLSVAYSGTWSSDPVTGTFASAANFGPRGLPNNPETFANKRFEAEPNYFYVKLDGSLVAHLPGGMQLVLRADGQYAVEPLIINEEFSITGADGVRGYLEAEVLADRGIKESVQLQSPVAHMRSIAVGDLFVFFDAGHADVIDPLAGQEPFYKLKSAGAGVALFPSYPVSGMITWADPLATGPFTHRGDSRILFIVRGSF
jgi:hemolysin activation/secretion protein